MAGGCRSLSPTLRTSRLRQIAVSATNQDRPPAPEVSNAHRAAAYRRQRAVAPVLGDPGSAERPTDAVSALHFDSTFPFLADAELAGRASAPVCGLLLSRRRQSGSLPESHSLVTARRPPRWRTVKGPPEADTSFRPPSRSLAVVSRTTPPSGSIVEPIGILTVCCQREEAASLREPQPHFAAGTQHVRSGRRRRRASPAGRRSRNSITLSSSSAITRSPPSPQATSSALPSRAMTRSGSSPPRSRSGSRFPLMRSSPVPPSTVLSAASPERSSPASPPRITSTSERTLSPSPASPSFARPSRVTKTWSRPVLVGDRVLLALAAEVVGPQAAVQAVVASAAEEPVGTRAADQLVRAVAADDDQVAAVELVVPASAVDGVRAGTAGELIVPPSALERVAAPSAEALVLALAAREQIVAGATAACCRCRLRRSGCPLHHGRRGSWPRSTRSACRRRSRRSPLRRPAARCRPRRPRRRRRHRRD